MSMEKELLNTFDKELLLKDLCARLPYGVKVNGVFLTYDKDKDKILYKECVKELNYSHLSRYWTLKPYLFPLSSMTDEEWKEYQKIRMIDCVHGDINGTFINPGLIVDWLNAHHFDYRGLIEKSLALDATGLNIYKSIRNPFIKIIMSGNKENIKLDPITFESYGARMRNLLTV